MMLFAGLRPERDLAIEFTGLNEGEKVTEELWETWEKAMPTEDPRILKISDQDHRRQGILLKIDQMEYLLAAGDQNALLEYLQDFAPDFQRNRKPETSRLAKTTNPSALVSEEAA
jgi:FlaA1/EpsC-like NDP-sugar epimerase